MNIHPSFLNVYEAKNQLKIIWQFLGLSALQRRTHAKTVTASARKAPIQITTKQPPPVRILPIFRSFPLFVKGMPIDLDIRDLAAEIPVNRFHEKPPLFI